MTGTADRLYVFVSLPVKDDSLHVGTRAGGEEAAAVVLEETLHRPLVRDPRAGPGEDHLWTDGTRQWRCYDYDADAEEYMLLFGVDPETGRPVPPPVVC